MITNSQKIENEINDVFNSDLIFNINTNKHVVITSLLGLGNNVNGPKNQSLPKLFDFYFKDKANKVYFEDDTKELIEMIGDKVGFLKTVKVKKGNFLDDRGKLVSCLVERFNEDEYIVGSSSIDHALWFHFVNDGIDVNNGTIYKRESSIKKLVRANTFDIKPFVQGKIEDGLNVRKSLSFNPNWLLHTLMNMEEHVFKTLVK